MTKTYWLIRDGKAGSEATGYTKKTALMLARRHGLTEADVYPEKITTTPSEDFVETLHELAGDF